MSPGVVITLPIEYVLHFQQFNSPLILIYQFFIILFLVPQLLIMYNYNVITIELLHNSILLNC